MCVCVCADRILGVGQSTSEAELRLTYRTLSYVLSRPVSAIQRLFPCLALPFAARACAHHSLISLIWVAPTLLACLCNERHNSLRHHPEMGGRAEIFDLVSEAYAGARPQLSRYPFTLCRRRSPTLMCRPAAGYVWYARWCMCAVVWGSLARLY